MAKSSTITLTIAETGDGLASATTYIPPGFPLSNVAAPGGVAVPTSLSSGDNTINVPTGAIGFCYVPPAGSAVTKQLRAVTATQGPSAPASAPLLWFFPTPAPSTIVINVGSNESGWITWF